jgi:hypothetical protein
MRVEVLWNFSAPRGARRTPPHSFTEVPPPYVCRPAGGVIFPCAVKKRLLSEQRTHTRLPGLFPDARRGLLAGQQLRVMRLRAKKSVPPMRLPGACRIVHRSGIPTVGRDGLGGPQNSAPRPRRAPGAGYEQPERLAGGERIQPGAVRPVRPRGAPSRLDRPSARPFARRRDAASSASDAATVSLAGAQEGGAAAEGGAAGSRPTRRRTAGRRARTDLPAGGWGQQAPAPGPAEASCAPPGEKLRANAWVGWDAEAVRAYCERSHTAGLAAAHNTVAVALSELGGRGSAAAQAAGGRGRGGGRAGRVAAMPGGGRAHLRRWRGAAAGAQTRRHHWPQARRRAADGPRSLASGRRGRSARPAARPLPHGAGRR